MCTISRISRNIAPFFPILKALFKYFVGFVLLVHLVKCAVEVVSEGFTYS